MPPKISKSIFASAILPGLEAKHTHKDTNKLDAKALDAEIKSSYTIIDDADGSEIVWETSVHAAPDNEDLASTIEKAIAKGFAPITKGLENLPRVSGGTPNIDVKTGGFKSVGHFMSELRSVATKCGKEGYQAIGTDDSRLPATMKAWGLSVKANAPTAYSAEGNLPDGGALVPPTWVNMIMKDAYDEETFMGRCWEMKTNGNSVTIPKDETTPWNTGSSPSGITASWVGEAQQITNSKPILGQDNIQLAKLAVMAPVTEEMTQDASQIGSYVPYKAGEVIAWALNDSLMNGNGAYQPLGFLNGAGTVLQSRASSGAVIITDITSMMQRMRPNNLKRAVWIINPNVWGSILNMVSAGAGTYPVYIPATRSIAEAPYGTLFGRPIIVSDHAQTLGTKGDISLVDWSQYLICTKTNGIEAATSIHLWFDLDLIAYRFLFRIAGQPWRSKVITPPNTTTTQGHFVTLNTYGA